MGELQTAFGRHEESLIDLEVILKGFKLPRYNALIIGAGLDKLEVFKWLPNKIGVNQPLWLQQKYSWEYLEVAAVLERLGKPWTLTVVDSSPRVCEAVQNQEEVIISAAGQGEYARIFLETFGVNYFNNGDLEIVNSALESARITNRLTIFYRLNIPPAVRERIKVVNGSVQNIDELALPHKEYDAITMFNVIQPITDYNDKTKAENALISRVAEAGVIATDLEFYGLLRIKPPRVYKHLDYGLECELTMYTYYTYFMGKQQALVVGHH